MRSFWVAQAAEPQISESAIGMNLYRNLVKEQNSGNTVVLSYPCDRSRGDGRQQPMNGIGRAHVMMNPILCPISLKRCDLTGG